jgi:hypothetical protein
MELSNLFVLEFSWFSETVISRTMDKGSCSNCRNFTVHKSGGPANLVLTAFPFVDIQETRN